MKNLRPKAAGLYDPNFEHDACGVGAVACLSGKRSHSTVERALHVLDHLEHRGASGAEADTGDGAGILPKDDAKRAEIERTIEQTVTDHGQELLGWRDVPVDSTVPGASAAAVEPRIRQVFVGSTLGDHGADDLAFERKIY